MAIDASKYGKLNNYSSQAGKESGPFLKVFISGVQREDQDIRKMHAICNGKWESKDIAEKYALHNAEAVNFIIMFIRKVRVKKENLGRGYDEITYYSYDPDNEPNYPVGAKCEYIFAGAILDENFKAVPSKEDPSQTALIFFQNNGIRVGPAVEYLGELGKKAADLEPLSNDPQFEQNCVTPRRFITQAKIGSRKTNYGNKDVYEYSAIKQLPDKNVESIIDKCMAWADPFDKQFDLSSVGSSQPTTKSEYAPDNENPTFNDDGGTSEPAMAEAGPSLDIPSEDIDLGI
jgi:hypothetical protein